MEAMKKRIFFVLFSFAIVWLILIVRVVHLQVLPHKKLNQLKNQIFETTLKTKPRRGVIYDRKGKELAISIPSQSLFADPKLLEQPYYCAKKIAQMFKKPKKQILKKLLNKKRRFVWLQRHLTEEQVKKVKSWKLKGLYFIKEPKRFYTKGDSLSQVLGFTDVDGRGLEGIEKQYDDFLKGVEQKFIVKRDAKGRPLFADFTFLINRVSGFDLYLTIDSDLQFYLEKELKQAIIKSSADSALGLVLDVKTAEILAMVNVPNYNPNQPLKINSFYRRNRTVTDVFEPGSTMKTFTVASALEQGILPKKTYSTHGGKLVLSGETIREADLKKKFSPQLNLSEILALSSNIGAAGVALDVGAKKLRKTLVKFGFGQKTGIDFVGERKGILHELPWRAIQTGTVSFGHGVAVTALQMASAYSAIANGGVLQKPLLVRSIRNSYTGEERHFSTEKIKKSISEKTSRLLTVMLAGVTEKNATGFKAKVSGYLTAGKTGTAQKVDLQKGGYKSGEYISSFVGFIPAHKPKFVIYIVIDGAKDNFYASSVAAPVFSDVASYAVRKAGLSPIVINEKDFISSEEAQVFTRGLASTPSHRVPNLKGLSLREVLAQMKGQDVKLKFYGSQRVIRTIPFAGEALPASKQITVILN